MDLNSQRLRLRPIRQSDTEDLLHLWRDPEVRRYLWDDRIIGTDEVNAVLSASESLFSERQMGQYALFKQGGSDLLGFCGLRLFEDGAQVELLYGILPDYWGEGLVSEAARTVLGHAFHNCGVDRIIGATDTPNQRSVKVMQRLGMSFDERREWHGLDTVFYSLTREEFEESEVDL